MRVLVIDDSLSSCKSISRILIDQATTYCCINSGDWEKHYQADKTDIILLDIMMPGIDGIDVLRQIREIDKDIPVVMVSAITDNDKIIDCLNLGANGYITKPISPDKIISSVKKISLINAVKDITTSTVSSLAELKRGISGCP